MKCRLLFVSSPIDTVTHTVKNPHVMSSILQQGSLDRQEYMAGQTVDIDNPEISSIVAATALQEPSGVAGGKEALSPEKMDAIKNTVGLVCDHIARLVDTALRQLNISHIELEFPSLSVLQLKVYRQLVLQILKGWKGKQLTLSDDPWLGQIIAAFKDRLQEVQSRAM